MSADRVFVTRRIPEPGLELLRQAGAEVTVGQPEAGVALPRERLLDGIARSDVVLCLLTERLDEEALGANPVLLGVANMAVGYDNVDLETATRLGIPVSNTPGVLTEATADLTWALLLAAARRLVEGDRLVRTGGFGLWDPGLLLGQDVGPGPLERRKRLGIVGFGRIGVAVARRAVGFDMEVVASDPRHEERIASSGLARAVALPELLESCDFVSLHVPSSPATRHLVGEAELRRMRSSAVLVNTARGSVVDEAALVRALREGWIAAAGLDVYEDEPRLAPGLVELDNVVLLPHVASASRETRELMACRAAEGALAHLAGRVADWTVDRSVYDTAAYRRRRMAAGR